MGLFSGVGYNNGTFSGFPGTGSFRGYYASRPAAPQPFGNGMFSPQGSSMGYGGYGGMGGYQNPQVAYADNRAPQDSMGQMPPWMQGAMSGINSFPGFDGSTQDMGNGTAMRQMAPVQLPQMSTPYQVNPAMTGGSASTIPQEVGSASNPNLPVLPPYNSRPHWGDGLQQAYMGAAQQYAAQLGGGMKPGFVSAPNQAAPTSGYVNPAASAPVVNFDPSQVLQSRVGAGNAGLWDYALGRR